MTNPIPTEILALVGDMSTENGQYAREKLEAIRHFLDAALAESRLVVCSRPCTLGECIMELCPHREPHQANTWCAPHCKVPDARCTLVVPK